MHIHEQDSAIMAPAGKSGMAAAVRHVTFCEWPHPAEIGGVRRDRDMGGAVAAGNPRR